MASIIDLIVVIGLMALCCCIGIYFRSHGGSSVEDYFMGRRNILAIPAALSITVSFLSSAAFTVYLGQVYSFGMPLYIGIATAIVAAPIVTQIFQPRLYYSPHLSVYHYLEERFSRSVRCINSAIFLLSSIIRLGVVGYTAAISGEVLVQVPFWISALAVGVFSTFYITIGGLKAVIWTDVTQAIVIITSFVIILVKVCLSFESFEEMWTTVNSGKRIQVSFEEGPTHRFSVQSSVFFQFIYQIYVLSICQLGVQRWKSVGSLADAKKTAVLTLVIMCVCQMLIYVTGLAIYAFYAKCTTQTESLPSADKISLHFVSTELSSWPGTLGLCLGGILSGALSTYSSYINSMAAVTLEDLVKVKYNCLSAPQEILISKALTAFYGLFGTCLIFLTEKATTVIMIENIAFSIAMSPLLGVFCLAMFSKRSNSMGAIMGISISTILLIWLSIGSMLQGNKHVPLASVNSLCLENQTAARQTLQNITAGLGDTRTSSFLESLYDISFSWFPTIGFFSTTIFGYLCSIKYWTICKKKRHLVPEDETLSIKMADCTSEGLLTGLDERNEITEHGFH